MVYVYAITVGFKTGDLLPSVKKVEDEVNNFLSDFRMDKISIYSRMPLIDVRAERQLTGEEREALVNTVKNTEFGPNKLKFKDVQITFVGRE